MDSVDLPLDRADQLPSLGVSREHLQIDFKAQVDVARQFEMAKDVAAFANSAGGVLLVGAVEEGNRLARYSPMPEERADAIRVGYSRAVANRCSPVPLCQPNVLRFESGFLVAVSVWPFPAQPIGVEIKADRANEGYGGSCFVFPLRTAVDTIWVQPEQLPMLMIPEVRRISFLLESIPHENRTDIHVTMRSGERALEVTTLDLIEVRVLQNVALFRGAAGKLPETVCHIPLDGIESVWSTASGTWRVALKGRISVENGRVLTYEPTR